MPDEPNLIVIIDLICLAASIPGNVFIFVVNIFDWSKNKRLCVTDQLITGISIFSLIHQSLESFAVFTWVTRLQGYFSSSYFKIIFSILMIIFLCYLLFSMWLCVHFCLKIVNINNNFYIRLQRTFPKMFPWLFIPTIIGSIFLSVPFMLYKKEELIWEKVTTAVTNETSSSTVPRGYRVWALVPYTVVCSLAFLLCSSSALNIVISLCRHMRSMRSNTEDFGGTSMEVHVRAVQTLTSILSVNVFVYTASFMALFGNQNLLFGAITPILTSICHICSSIIQIKGNYKLDKALSDALACCPCNRI